MGDPKKLKKKYSTPVHPWNKTEIDKNKILRYDARPFLCDELKKEIERKLK